MTQRELALETLSKEDLFLTHEKDTSVFRIKFRGKYITANSGKTVWASKAGASHALSHTLKYHYLLHWKLVNTNGQLTYKGLHRTNQLEMVEVASLQERDAFEADLRKMLRKDFEIVELK